MRVCGMTAHYRKDEQVVLDSFVRYINYLPNHTSMTALRTYGYRTVFGVV
jgi:hypothetical protein